MNASSQWAHRQLTVDTYLAVSQARFVQAQNGGTHVPNSIPLTASRGTSCTRAEGPGCNGGAGFDGRLVHPLEPRTVRASVRARF